MEIIINYWAVLAAVAANVALGFLWYGPLFGRQWMRTIHMTKDDMAEASQKGVWRTYALMLIGTFLTAYVLAHVLANASAFTGETGSDAGMSAGFFMWLGFVAPVTLGSVLWEQRPWKYWFITTGYYLVALVLMGAILGVWS